LVHLGTGMQHALLVAVTVLALVLPAGGQSGRTLPAAASVPTVSYTRRADFGQAAASAQTRFMANWIADSGDNHGTAFVIVDKPDAMVHVFDSHAHLRASSRALLGSARGDDTVPGIGTRPIALVKPEERTTPAGRFVAERGHNASGEDVVWVDYEAAVSMHRVLTTHPSERRLQRLASDRVSDRRISYGCINLPVAFYESEIRPMVARERGLVYVLPDIKSAQQVFGAYQVNAADVDKQGHAPENSVR
jgi:hypothetical protein